MASSATRPGVADVMAFAANLKSSEMATQIAAARNLAEVLNECDMVEGTQMGQALRDHGVIGDLASLLGKESDELSSLALYCLANLCCDSVDNASAASKHQLFACNMGPVIVQALNSKSTNVISYASGLCLNLSSESDWNTALVDFGCLQQLEQLISHEDQQIVFQSKSLLVNMLRDHLPPLGTTEESVASQVRSI